MAYSNRWVTLACISCVVLSGCSLIDKVNTFTGSVSDNSEETIETDTEQMLEAGSVSTGDGETVSSAQPVSDPSAEASPPTQSNHFREGVNRAQSAVAIGQSAQSTDDWSFAANRWKQAVALMQQVPKGDPNYATAQQKIQEYQQNATQAGRRAAGEMPGDTQAVDPDRPAGLAARIPVVSQMGGTPVVPVTLSGSKATKQFTMLFDTGATGTLITQAMANEIGVLVIDTAIVTVADGRQVEIPIGYVDTLQVGDLVVHDIVVGIGGDMALLGQDVYGEYGLSIGGNSIDLYE